MNRRNSFLLITNISLLGVVLIALILRAMHLSNGLAGDEGFTCGIILEGFSGIIRQTLILNEPHPVGYYFLLRAWILLTGNSELATRWLSVWFGVLAVALLARFCFELFPGRYGRYVALAAAGLMAVNSFTVSQSREMRMYAMLLALSLASTLLMLMALQRPTPPELGRLHRRYLAGFANALLCVIRGRGAKRLRRNPMARPATERAAQTIPAMDHCRSGCGGLYAAMALRCA